MAAKEQPITATEASFNVAVASPGIPEINQKVAQRFSMINDITREIDAPSDSAKACTEGIANINSSTTELNQLSEDVKLMVAGSRPNRDKDAAAAISTKRDANPPMGAYAGTQTWYRLSTSGGAGVLPPGKPVF